MAPSDSAPPKLLSGLADMATVPRVQGALPSGLSKCPAPKFGDKGPDVEDVTKRGDEEACGAPKGEVIGAADGGIKPGQPTSLFPAFSQQHWPFTVRGEGAVAPSDPAPPKLLSSLADMATVPREQGALPSGLSKCLVPKFGDEGPNVEDATKRGERGAGVESEGCGGGRRLASRSIRWESGERGAGVASGGCGGCRGASSRPLRWKSGERGPSPASLPEYSGPGTAAPPPALDREMSTTGTTSRPSARCRFRGEAWLVSYRRCAAATAS